MTTTRSRSVFVKDASRFASRCAGEGAEWDGVWEQIEGGCAIAAVELTPTERMSLYEAWDAAYPWPERSTA